ncbi:MAG: DUF5667 domain-containing protein [bacterium]|nr:DUF5667 domain-containing protein [bacterium]
MREEEEKILMSLKNFTLNSVEKDQVRERLLAFIKLKPVRTGIGDRHQYRSKAFGFALSYMRKPMPIIISIVVLLTAGTSIAAEKAMPGDMLYPIKITVNEEARAFVSFDSEAKAEWEIRRTERRLEEAEHLAAQGRLDAEVSERIEANFQEHAERVRVRIADFEAKDNPEVGADLSEKFEASLRAHEEILLRFAKSTSTAPAEIEAEVETDTEIEGGVRGKSKIEIEIGR